LDFPSILFWGLMVAGVRSRGPLMIYIFFGCLSFGTTAVVPPALVGGVSFTPGWMAMAFLTLKLVSIQPSLSEALSPLFDFRRIGLLTACTIYGVISAYFCPRLFEGQIDVFAVRYDGLGATPLQPSSANITQTFYFIMTTVGVLSFYLAARAPELRRHLLNAILFGGGVAVLTGFADIATSAVGLGAILAPFRTATYSYLTEAEILGAKRVVGLCSEASSYSGLCMGLATPLFFLRHAFQRPFTRNVLAPLIFALLVLMTALSTSSTGYVGLGLLGAVIALYGVWQVLKARASGWQDLTLVYATAAAIFAIVVLKADLLQRAAQMVDEMVFNKTESSSYIERSTWNTLTFQAFLSTHGLGAGLGSARASSWVISILGNIGVIGAALMMAFLGLSMLSHPPKDRTQDDALATGAKVAMIPILAMASLASSSVGFDLITACMFGLIGAVSWGPEGASPTSWKTARRLMTSR
jgi:hypothetical protein